MNTVLLLISLVALSGVVKAIRTRRARLRIVYDPSQRKTFEMPKSCKDEGQEYCFDDENYPIGIVEEVLRDVKSLVVADENGFEATDSYSDRQGIDYLESECPTASKNETIYYIKDEEGRDRVVVQLKDKFHQQFGLKWCLEEGPLLHKTKHFMQDMVTNRHLYCQTKYMHYDFLVLSMEPGLDLKYKMEKARTKTGIPVCCACRYDK